MKKALSLILAVLLMISVSVSALATSAFDASVLDSAEGLTTTYDDMTGVTKYYSKPLMDGKKAIYLNFSTTITVIPTVAIGNYLDMYFIGLYYVGADWANIDHMIVKIGDRRYTLSGFKNSRSTRTIGYVTECQEYFYFFATNETIPMLQDIAEHKDEEIKVRFAGSRKNVDFVLTDEIKDGIVNLYDLYSAGGGLRTENIDKLSETEKITVSVSE